MPLPSLASPRGQARRVLLLAATLGLAPLLGAPLARADFIYPYYAITYYPFGGGLVVGPPPPPGPGVCGAFCLGGNIGRRAFIVRQGRGVVVSGPVRCGRGEDVNLRITVNQRRRAALAQAGLRGPCPVGLRRYQVALPARVGTFAPGRAFACLLGATERAGRYLDVNQWCHPITLVTGTPPPAGR